VTNNQLARDRSLYYAASGRRRSASIAARQRPITLLISSPDSAKLAAQRGIRNKHVGDHDIKLSLELPEQGRNGARAQ
jgi:hypothetical protein